MEGMKFRFLNACITGTLGDSFALAAVVSAMGISDLLRRDIQGHPDHGVAPLRPKAGVHAARTRSTVGYVRPSHGLCVPQQACVRYRRGDGADCPSLVGSANSTRCRRGRQSAEVIILAIICATAGAASVCIPIRGRRWSPTNHEVPIGVRANPEIMCVDATLPQTDGP